jgi:acyl-coenzyme A thioesterase PaaI-like protein
MDIYDTSKFREVFAPLEWAAPYLDHPDWDFFPRRRTFLARPPDASYDGYCVEALPGETRIQAWAELCPKIASTTGAPAIDRTMSLYKFGAGLSGYINICHGGAIMSMMDEALGAMMLAKMREAEGIDQVTFIERWDMMWGVEPGKMISGMKDFFVTAKLELKFLAPVMCPGVVGVECTLVEKTKNKMRINAVMKDGKGRPLVAAESLWVRTERGKL